MNVPLIDLIETSRQLSNNTYLSPMSETAPAVEPKKPVDPMMGEDPRVKGGEKKLVKKGGVGRNT